MPISRPDTIDIRRVAAEAEVSIATVSRVLNQPERVAAKTRGRVLEVAQRLGYRPNSIARGLVTGKSHTVGMVIPDIEGPLYGALVRGVEDVLRQAGMHSMLVSSDRNPQREFEELQSLLERQLDGVIVVGSDLPPQTLELLTTANCPWVLLDREGTFVPNSVALDNRGGGRKAAQYLIAQGHHRIAHIAGIRHAGTERLEGFKEALQAAGLQPFAITQGDFSEASGAMAAEELLEQGIPEAIFVANDRMAAGVYRTLRLHRVQIPQQVSLIGFDNAPFSEYLEPPLTTLRQPVREMGRVAGEMLMQLRDGAAVEAALIAPQLLLRDSVAAKPTEVKMSGP